MGTPRNRVCTRGQTPYRVSPRSPPGSEKVALVMGINLLLRDAKEGVSRHVWVRGIARNPLVRLQLWIRPPLRIQSRSSNLERRRTLLPSLDVPEGCATPFGFSKNLRCSPYLQLLRAQPLPQLQISQAVAQVREVKASASQRVRVCDHLDPMDTLEVEPPVADQWELWRANYAKLKGGSLRRHVRRIVVGRVQHNRWR